MPTAPQLFDLEDETPVIQAAKGMTGDEVGQILRLWFL